MNKAVMLSVRPKWVGKIANGEKTIEVRKTKPNLPTPFKAYIYCSQGNDARRLRGSWGKVIGEFTCDRIFPINVFDNGSIQNWLFEHMERSCLTYEELADYIGNGKTGHGWHISDLRIYDVPKDLNEFWLPPELYCEKERCGGCPYDQVADVNGEYSFDCEWKRPLTRPPQSWYYVEEG